MKLESQVCTLDQAKRLNELGIVQGTSYMCWLQNLCHDETDFHLEPMNYPGCSDEGYENFERGCLRGYAAFTVAELGRMIGSGTYAATLFHDAVMDRIDSGHSMTIATSAQFVASCVIGLLEKEIMPSDGANERLKR